MGSENVHLFKLKRKKSGWKVPTTLLVLKDLAAAVAAVVSPTAVVTAAQDDQHQNDDGDQDPVIIKTIAQTHVSLSPPNCHGLFYVGDEKVLQKYKQQYTDPHQYRNGNADCQHR